MAGPRTKRRADPTLESPLELLLVLESLYARLQREKQWKHHSALLTVVLPERWLLGADFTRLWFEQPGTGQKLHGLDKRSFLAQHASARPQLLLGEPIWRFAYFAAGPLAKCLTLVSGTAALRQVHEAVDAALRELRAFRRRVAKALPALGDGPAWRRCVICSPLPELSFFPPPADAAAAGAVQVRSHYLQLLGEPLFSDFGGSREWCIKRCPLCATHYLWKTDYEYLVNGGTETEVTLTRLEPEELPQWLDLVAAGLRLGTRPNPLERP